MGKNVQEVVQRGIYIKRGSYNKRGNKRELNYKGNKVKHRSPSANQPEVVLKLSSP
jgi:hypothetical protein